MVEDKTTVTCESFDDLYILTLINCNISKRI